MRKAQAHSPTKEKLLEAAQRLMLAKGFPATTIDGICDAAELTKGSFFHYFESKEDLGKAVLERFCATQFQRVGNGSFRKKRDPLQRVYGYVDRYIELTKQATLHDGCLLGTFAQELSDTYPSVRTLCAMQFAQWEEGLNRELDTAKVQYAPKASFDTQSLAEHFIAVFEGAWILAKTKRDLNVLDRNLRHFKRYLKSVFEGGA